MKRGASVTGLGALLVCAPMACSELDPLDDTCLTVDGVNCNPASMPDADMPPPADGPWDCLGATQARPLPAEAPRGIAFIVPIVDFANPPQVVDGLTVVGCQDADFDCTQPFPIPLMNPPGAPNYVYQFNLPYRFEGYLRFNAPGYVQSEYYFLGPVIGGPNGEPVVYGDGIGLPTTATIDNFFRQFGQGAQRVPGTGLVGFRVYDCRNELPESQIARMQGALRRASGVRLKLVNTEATPWTLISGRPASPLPGEAALLTDDRGVAGFFNIQPLSLVVEAIAPDGTVYGRNNVNVRADQLTQANIRPNYSFAD